MDIILASSEVVPFAKTGGLADVAGALPRELNRLGNRVTVFLPAYGHCHRAGLPIEPTDVELEIPLGSKLVEGRLLRSQLPDSDVVVYLVDQPDYFHRDELYTFSGKDFQDNCERFVFFCRGVLESIRLLGLNPQLIHANDWQTALIPALLRTEYSEVPQYEKIASLITIHNLAYQGIFWHWDMLLTGMDWKYFNWKQMEFYGKLNLLKTGIAFADIINTVSPTYAKEIQTPEQGCGLHHALQFRSNEIFGIINGIDPKEWNPKTDSHLPANYDVNDFEEGKRACKEHLQKEGGLPVDHTLPLVGIVGRLAEQKGWSLIIPVMEKWLASRDVQWIVLGTGQPEYHDALAGLAEKYPDKLALTLDFSNQLAHQIEAGSDIFLMPSQYEPCGLNQMYSMAYGTIPVVRRTGGLADTVVHANHETVANQTANGFWFENFSESELESALDEAVRVYSVEKETWSQLIRTGMNHDWSWTASAKAYQALYQHTLAKHSSRLPA